MVNETVIQKDLIVNGLGSFGDRKAGEIINNDLEVFNSVGDVSFGIIADNGSKSILNFAETDLNTIGQIVFNHATNTFDIRSEGDSRIIVTTTGTTITGDLTVTGTTTTVNSTDLNITDNIILLNKDETGPGVSAGVAGIEIERGPATDNAGWFYNEAEDWWGPTGPAGILGIGGATQKIGNVAVIDSTDANNILDFNSTGAIIISRGTVAQRPSSPINGMLRYNNNDNVLEGHINSNWLTIGAFPPGGGFLPLGGGTITGDITMSSGSQILLDAGTVTEPGLAFFGDTNTGLFRVAADIIGIATGGGIRIQTSTTETDFFVDVDLNGNTLFGVADPSPGPTGGTHVGDRDYNDARYINISGDAMTGTFTTQNVLPDTDVEYDIGSLSFKYNEIFAITFNGTATSAKYADLAERYAVDMELTPGTVVIFGGEVEITESYFEFDTAVAGIISTDPAYMMNSHAGTKQTHPYVALKGKVPCKVIGPIKKGDLIVTSKLHGYGKSAGKKAPAYTAFARALEDFNGESGMIQVSVI